MREISSPNLFSPFNSARNTGLDAPIMGNNPGRLCWSNRYFVSGNQIGGDIIIDDWQGSSYRCGEIFRETANCYGYEYRFSNVYTGAGACRLFESWTVASRQVYMNINLYVMDEVYCPGISSSF